MSKKHPDGQAPRCAPTVTPANRFVGVVQADGQEAPVTGVACQETGEVVILVLTGPRTTAAVVAAGLHLKKTRKIISFLPNATELWRGPKRLQSMQNLGSSWIVSPVGPTTQQNVAIIANAANIAFCQLNRIPFPGDGAPGAPPSEKYSPHTAVLLSHLQPQPLPPPRFVLGNEGAAHPD